MENVNCLRIVELLKLKICTHNLKFAWLSSLVRGLTKPRCAPNGAITSSGKSYESAAEVLSRPHLDRATAGRLCHSYINIEPAGRKSASEKRSSRTWRMNLLFCSVKWWARVRRGAARRRRRASRHSWGKARARPARCWRPLCSR